MQKKVVVEKGGIKKEISFRKILLNRCQREFEKENSLQKTIDEKLADLVNQGLNVSTATELITFISWSFAFYFDGDVIKDWGFFKDSLGTKNTL